MRKRKIKVKKGNQVQGKANHSSNSQEAENDSQFCRAAIERATQNPLVCHNKNRLQFHG